MAIEASPPAAPCPPRPGLSAERKRTQRERLLSASIEVFAQDGFSAATIARIVANAGVSRPTFYDYFTDKDDCFSATIRAVSRPLLADIDAAVARRQPARASHATAESLLDFVITEPAGARLLMNETLAGGPIALDARDATITEIARLIDAAHSELADANLLPDLPSTVLVGGLYRFLGTRIRLHKRIDADVLADLVSWVDAYTVPYASRRWHTLASTHPRIPGASTTHSTLRWRPHAPNRRAKSRKAARATNRQRVLAATASVVRAKSFRATTIADIAAAAQLDPRAVTALFADTEQAFLAAHDLGFRQTMAVTAGGFFSRARWPDRTWAAGLAFTKFFESGPDLAHLGFVEAYAVGASMLRRMDSFHRAFTLFLHEGYTYPARTRHPPRRALDAIAAAISELAYEETRNYTAEALSALLPHATYIALAPFLGITATNEFIDRQLQD